MSLTNKNWELLDKYFQDDTPESRNFIIESFYPNIIVIAKKVFRKIKFNSSLFDLDDAISVASICLVKEVSKNQLKGCSAVDFFRKLEITITRAIFSHLRDSSNDFPSSRLVAARQFIQKLNDITIKRTGHPMNNKQLLAACEQERLLRKTNRRKIQKKPCTELPVLNSAILGYLQLPRIEVFKGLPIKHTGFDEVDVQDFMKLIGKPLTKSEKIILNMIYDGYTYKEIQKSINLSESRTGYWVNFVKKRAVRVLEKESLIL